MDWMQWIQKFFLSREFFAVLGAMLVIVSYFVAMNNNNSTTDILGAGLSEIDTSTGPGAEIRLHEIVLGTRISPQIMAMAIEYPVLRGLFGFNNHNTPDYVKWAATTPGYGFTYPMMIKLIYMSETKLEVAPIYNGKYPTPPTELQAILLTLLGSSAGAGQPPSVDIKPGPRVRKGLLQTLNQYMPIAGILLMGLTMF